MEPLLGNDLVEYDERVVVDVLTGAQALRVMGRTRDGRLGYLLLTVEAEGDEVANRDLLVRTIEAGDTP